MPRSTREAASHGTGRPEAIAARRTMVGTAPQVGLLTVRGSARKPTARRNHVQHPQRARLGGREGRPRRQYELCRAVGPRLKDALLKAYQKGMVLIAAGRQLPVRIRRRSFPQRTPTSSASPRPIPTMRCSPAPIAALHRRGGAGVDILAPAPDGTINSPRNVVASPRSAAWWPC